MKKSDKPNHRTEDNRRKTRWYDGKLSKYRAMKFFDELRKASKFYMEEHIDFDPDQWNTDLIKTNKKFIPKGAVIHTSGMKTLKETLLTNNSGIYSSHFIIPSNRYGGFPKDEFPLLNELPGTIIMPFDLFDHIPHSGYLSPVTWGIEMRSMGQLRPNEEKFVGPLDPHEVNDYNLRLWKRTPVYYYWRGENWTDPYEGPAYTWQGYHYEKFTKEQYISLIVLLKCLTVINRWQMNAALILPSSAIIDNPHNCPILPVDYFQKKVSIINSKDKLFKLNGLYAVYDRSNFYNRKKVEFEKETNIDSTRVIEDRIRENAWRGTDDREMLKKVFKHGEQKFMNAFHHYKKAVESMGYFTYEHYFTKSMQLYANARGIELTEDALCHELEKDYYSLVNGVYDV